MKHLPDTLIILDTTQEINSFGFKKSELSYENIIELKDFKMINTNSDFKDTQRMFVNYHPYRNELISKIPTEIITIINKPEINPTKLLENRLYSTNQPKSIRKGELSDFIILLFIQKYNINFQKSLYDFLVIED